MSFTQTVSCAWKDMRLQERAALALYGRLTRLLPGGLILAVLRQRAKRNPGREAVHRIPERIGLGLPKRPNGSLIWLNTIGPGDATALLPLIRAILKYDPNAICMVTTRTASAQKVYQRLDDLSRVIVQLAPLDLPAALQRFLDHWQPDLAIFNEGDLWPNTFQMLKVRNVPIALVNMQMNGRLGRAVGKRPKIAQWMLSHVDYVHLFPETDIAKARPWFRLDCKFAGSPNLKADAPPLTVSNTIMGVMRARWGDAPILTCASIANHEVETLLETAKLLRQALPDLRLILVPRWVEQGAGIAEIVRASGASFSCRASGELPRAEDQVFVADSYGEMGNWIELSFAVFMGHTLGGGIGHNPYEPIAQKRMILSGSIPHLLRSDYQNLVDLDLCYVAEDAPALAKACFSIWKAGTDATEPFAKFARLRGFAEPIAAELLSLNAQGKHREAV